MKTEKEKMLAGELYDAGDRELITRWHRAKQLQQEYNRTDSTARDELERILDELVGKRGRNVWIAAPFFTDYGENIRIGDNVEINTNCVFLDCNRITIGDNCGIGPGVHIYTVSHPVKASERLSEARDGEFPFWRSMTAPVTIGRNVWICGNTVILPGVTIGDGTTIGAGSVVTKSIPAGCLAVGNPCRVIRML